MKFGIDRLLTAPELRRPLEGQRVALIAHPASVTDSLGHSLDALIAALASDDEEEPQYSLDGDLIPGERAEGTSL